ncbi:MAG: class I SAM-dependent methyltransferase [Armatimonadetes bacterium]|nr:class I SAM-dependent methyltransferase [Armatimonadota bacterium]
MPELPIGHRLILLSRRWGLAVSPLARSRRWVSRLFLGGLGTCTLDLGCGDGHYALAAARRGGRVLGVSNDPRALERAAQLRDFCGLAPDQVEFQCADLRAWQPAPDEQYDQILLLAVTEHLLDDAGLLRRVRPALKPDGLLFVSAPNRACGLQEKRVHVAREETGRHVRHGYTFEQLEALLARCGYEPVDRRGFGWFGTQATMRAEWALSLPSPVLVAVRVLGFLLWRLLTAVLDRVPVREPYLLMVIARKAAAP